MAIFDAEVIAKVATDFGELGIVGETDILKCIGAVVERMNVAMVYIGHACSDKRK